MTQSAAHLNCANKSVDMARPPVFALSLGTKIWMLACNWIPVGHLLLVGIAGYLAFEYSVWLSVAASLFALFLLPPAFARLALLIHPIRDGNFDLGSSTFRTWWLVAQLQVLFNRLPILEAVVRLIPIAYSMWLRLWGSRVGKNVFWSPGVVVLDRSFIDVEDNCVFGIGVRLHPHLISKELAGDNITKLVIGRIRVGAGSLIGGFSLLASGVTVAPGSETPAVLALPAWAQWENGRRTKGTKRTVIV